MTSRGIILGAVSPHPPIVVPEIGEHNLDRVRKTRDGLQELANLVRDLDPDTVVIMAPHGPVIRDGVTLLASPILEGHFREFGVEGALLRYGNDTRLVNRIVAEGQERGVRVVAADPQKIASFRVPATLHYAILVPLYYLKQAGVECRLVAGAVGLLTPDAYYRLGQAVQAAAEELGTRVVYIASGDLSHRLTDGAPAGYDPLGRVFDERVIKALADAEVDSLMKLDPELVEHAGECGLGPIISLFGALDGRELMSEVISYEGPFGVGYAVASFMPKGPAAPAIAPAAEERTAVAEPEPELEPRPEASEPPLGTDPALPEVGPSSLQAGLQSPGDGPASPEVEPTGDDSGLPPVIEPESAGDDRPGHDPAAEPAEVHGDDSGPGGPIPAPAGAHPLVRLARLALETYVRNGRQIAPPSASPGLDRTAGAFVSLKVQGQLRGCIGTIEPTTPSLAEEVIRNAVQAGTGDPRFYPVTEDELAQLQYSVDVLEPPEPVNSLADLDPRVYGVIVTQGDRTGLLLPNLEGIDTAKQQVDIARQKAGIRDAAGVRLFRFRVTRYH